MPKSEWIGKKLGNRYLIDEVLGQGGMSAVYRASDPNLKRVVAIKIIHSHLSTDPDFVQRFEEEAAAVAQLRHHGIIQVYDFNRDDDMYYMVLEFVPGETVQDHLKRLNTDGRRLSISKAIEYMAEICDAVDYAHRRGMIHRDIKPANIMLNLMGQAILMDFGISKMVGSQRHTATGAVVGTAMYMSPEQIKGEHPDRRTDVYSLGVTLFEMASGRPPFQADSAMTLMMMHINDPVPDPKKLNPEVPDDLVVVINKALAKNPDERYQTAAEMASALRNVLARIKSGASAEISGPSATMLEQVTHPSMKLKAITPEPPAPVEGTVVESAPHPSVAASGVARSVPGTAMESSAVASSAVRPIPAPQPPGADAQPKKSMLSMPMIAGISVLLACLIFGGLFLVNRLLDGRASAATESPVAALDNTETLAPTSEQVVAPLATETLAVTEAPTETATPDFTPTPEGPYVVITEIRNQGDLYAVDYEVHNFPDEANLHVHIFFDTVPPEQAGSPGAGPWKLTWGTYGNPPFTQYGVANRPADATQLCALVANPNHSIQLNTGNCVNLP
ncbi:MAG: serine/threonine protein kinase [Chloroflexi bacterium]|nr:MAG: serine/threonine protein kinase [Chloroflexota bacterium]